jgi:DNA replication protein DnaC
MYERASVIITTNMSFGEWVRVFHDVKMTAELLDSLTHNRETIETGNDSFRLRQQSNPLLGKKG